MYVYLHKENIYIVYIFQGYSGVPGNTGPPGDPGARGSDVSIFCADSALNTLCDVCYNCLLSL